MLIPMLTMAVGFLLGMIATDAYKSDGRVDKLERKLRRLERKMEAAE